MSPLVPEANPDHPRLVYTSTELFNGQFDRSDNAIEVNQLIHYLSTMIIQNDTGDDYNHSTPWI